MHGLEGLLGSAAAVAEVQSNQVQRVSEAVQGQVVSSLMQALVAAGEARCLRLHQQLGAACNVTIQAMA
ncbi:hypothetical protein HaLaN_23870 [Haematococcus lacustris]|uniref:Uncharacterized protein n=1 Tax=Haematococcus lacustris TaxID=44745 RepID=A0A6A0A2P5_HAELA|nr:hypothetical protein HaLaN_23870 [Haematococcus lacustris]